jgi:aspartyl/asparaginyl beta-hydroxylase (cupin superfamily)
MNINTNYKDLLFYNTEKIKKALDEADQKIWELDTFRQRTYDQHKKTQSIVYIWSEADDHHYDNVKIPIPREDSDELNREVYKAADLIKEKFSKNSVITRLMLAKLTKECHIGEHSDPGNLTKIHRCHLPIITNDECLFYINGEPYNFKENFAVEINNQRRHKVYAGNEDRIHLICDILEKKKWPFIF